MAKLYANIIKQISKTLSKVEEFDRLPTQRNAEVVELADAPDSKSGDGDIVRVQVPPSAP